jgi:Flp pilus assembly protein TadD
LPRTVEETRAALRRQPDSAPLQGQLTYLLIKQQQYREGLVEARRWLQLDPKSAPGYSAVGVCSVKLGDLVTAKDAFMQEVKISPANLRAHFNLGLVCGQLREREKALAELNYVVKYGGDTQEGKEAKQVLERLTARRSPLSVP